MKKQALLILATAAALIAGTRAARYLQLVHEQSHVADTEPGYVIPANTQPVTMRTSIGDVTFGPNHEFQPDHRAYHKGHALFVYLPAGYGFGQSDEHNEYVLRLSLALLYTTKGRFRMEPVPHIAEGGDPNASAMISAGSNNKAYWQNHDGEEPSVWAGTPLAYTRYMGDDPAPDFDQMVKLVAFLIEHPRYVEQACRKIASLVGMTNLAK